jgi:hypothetical protein
LEANVNVFIGFFVSLVAWIVIVVPFWKLEVSFLDNLTITGLFTVLAIARGYLVRRFFAKRLHKAIHRFVRRIYA